MKKWQKILIIVVAVILGLGIIKNPVVKTIVTAGASHVMGARVRIMSFAVGVFKQGVRIKGLKVYNPRGFPKEVLMDIGQVNVKYKLPAVLKGKLHLPQVVFDLKELVVIKNKDGKLNIDALRVVKQKEKKKKSKKMAMQIDELRLNLGKVIVKDYSKTELPVVLGYDINVKNKVYKNIKSAQQLAALVMLESIGPAGLKGAAVYSAPALLGVGLLPAGVAGVLASKDSSIAEYRVSREAAYKKVGKLIKRIGGNVQEDKKDYLIKAKVYDSDVTVKFSKGKKRGVRVKVTARKLVVPKPEVAEGIMYQISKILK
ncbi:MAG: hypothetical protein JSV34_02525 [Candidatus Omnitrophota bacterium]|nr:MAG: hypothetical protein JSV34_02525 [Candidatus Omnitrophota bacterium]